MAISVYQVDCMIKAYNKQSRTRLENQNQDEDSTAACYRDYVTLSNAPVDKAATFEKISYNIRDIIIKNTER
ncbi:MAG: hypothetical protein A4E66_01453 [Syntrophus sp. PtaB.Bin001]|nr:MAG: hypothetical protein A4E66_01453 [Syntrophus sp. PtaB.Bin001]